MVLSLLVTPSMLHFALQQRDFVRSQVEQAIDAVVEFGLLRNRLAYCRGSVQSGERWRGMEN
jgi:hypothetical protein